VSFTASCKSRWRALFRWRRSFSAINVPPNAARRRRTTWKRPDLLTMTCCEPEMMLNLDGAAAFLSSSPMVVDLRARGWRRVGLGLLFCVGSARAARFGLPEPFGSRRRVPGTAGLSQVAAPTSFSVGPIYQFFGCPNTWNCGRKAAALNHSQARADCSTAPSRCQIARNASAPHTPGGLKASPSSQETTTPDAAARSAFHSSLTRQAAPRRAHPLKSS